MGETFSLDGGAFDPVIETIHSGAALSDCWADHDPFVLTSHKRRLSVILKGRRQTVATFLAEYPENKAQLRIISLLRREPNLLLDLAQVETPSEYPLQL